MVILIKYMGSKSRIKRHIVPILQTIIDENNINIYVEPFVGGANIIDAINCEYKIGSDISEPLIELLIAISTGQQLPPEVPKELYDDVRSNKDTDKYPKWFVGAVGYLASYNGRYFDGGYAKTLVTKTGVTRNYYDEAKRNLEKQASNLKDIHFIHERYDEIEIPEGALVYCDIPYRNKKQYGICTNFNHDKFWEWVRMISESNIVVVSEEEAPDDFECIWEQGVLRTQNNRKHGYATEKLFIYKEEKNE